MCLNLPWCYLFSDYASVSHFLPSLDAFRVPLYFTDSAEYSAWYSCLRGCLRPSKVHLSLSRRRDRTQQSGAEAELPPGPGPPCAQSANAMCQSASQRTQGRRTAHAPALPPSTHLSSCPGRSLSRWAWRVPCSHSGDVWLLCCPLKHTVPSWQLVSLRT